MCVATEEEDDDVMAIKLTLIGLRDLGCNDVNMHVPYMHAYIRQSDPVSIHYMYSIISACVSS